MKAEFCGLFSISDSCAFSFFQASFQILVFYGIFFVFRPAWMAEQHNMAADIRKQAADCCNTAAEDEAEEPADRCNTAAEDESGEPADCCNTAAEDGAAVAADRCNTVAEDGSAVAADRCNTVAEDESAEMDAVTEDAAGLVK